MKIVKGLLLFAVMAVCVSYIYKVAIYDKKQKIEVQKLVSNGNTYEDLKVITNQKDVKEIRRILNETTWDTATAKSSRPADYRFIFQYVNPNIEAKSISYQVWINSENAQVDLYRDTNEHSLLSNEDTISFLKILLH
jgi:hypothetical protein